KVLRRLRRGMCAMCIGGYVLVFIGAIPSGGAELLSVGRAVGCTLVAALRGRTALGFLAQASVRGEPFPMAVEERKVGSLVELLRSTNVPEQPDEAAAA